MQRRRGLQRAARPDPDGTAGQPTSTSPRSVVTVGVFDGVHRGHQQIVARAVQRGHASGLPVSLLTFDPHPSSVVRPGGGPLLLTTPRHKAELVEALGVDVLHVVPFTPAFSRLSPDEFVEQVLVRLLGAAAVVVGQNFRYGSRAAGDVDSLAAAGAALPSGARFDVEGVALLADDGAALSSSVVRQLVAEGDVAAAARVLGRPHRVEGVVVHGDQRGRTIGYPTANLAVTARAAVPADGVYAGWVVRGDERLPAAISIGSNPTFGGQERRVEAYVLDLAVGDPGSDLYGEQLALDVAERLRGTETYDSVEALVDQMGRDVARTRELTAGA